MSPAPRPLFASAPAAGTDPTTDDGARWVDVWVVGWDRTDSGRTIAWVVDDPPDGPDPGPMRAVSVTFLRLYVRGGLDQ